MPDRAMKDVFQILQKLPLDEEPLLMRGQRDRTWEIRPSIGRHYKYPWGGNVLEQERALLQNFKKRIALYRSTPTSDIELLCMMQHHGCHTRLLDFTTNPLVALYFACELPPDRLMPETDGEIIVLHDAPLDKDPQGDIFGHQDVFVYRPVHVSERIQSQAGCFVYCPTPNQTLGRIAKRIKVAKERKSAIRDQLGIMNVNDSTLFPGIDGICRTLNKEMVRQLRSQEEVMSEFDSLK